jgi:hypothetical protein
VNSELQTGDSMLDDIKGRIDGLVEKMGTLRGYL